MLIENSQFLYSLSEMLVDSSAQAAFAELIKTFKYKHYVQLIGPLEQEVSELKTALGKGAELGKLYQAVDPLIKEYPQKEMILKRISEISAQIDRFKFERDKIQPQLSEINSHCIDEFIKKFKNIQHLTQSLSDAPKELKKFLPMLYSRILINLEKEEQEKQLAELSSSDIDLIVNETIDTYNGTNDPAVRQVCQRLVHMVLFEEVQKHALAVPKISELTEKTKYSQRLLFLKKVADRIPNVGSSDILDSICEYQNSKNQTISILLHIVDRKLKVDFFNEYQDPSVLAGYQLREKLRFGFSELRSHAKKYKNNVAKDLFWARNIRDMELFIKGETEQVFTDIEGWRYLFAQSEKKIKLFNDKKSKESPAYKLSVPSEFHPMLNQFTRVLSEFKESRGIEHHKSILSELEDETKKIKDRLNNTIKKIAALTIRMDELADLHKESEGLTELLRQKEKLKETAAGFNAQLKVIEEKERREMNAYAKYDSFVKSKRTLEHEPDREEVIQNSLERFNHTVNFSETKTGEITAEFFYIEPSDDIIKNFRKVIEHENGFGHAPDTLVLALYNTRKLTEHNCTTKKFSGKSLSDIKEKIIHGLNELSNHTSLKKEKKELELNSYNNYLKVLESKIIEAQPQKIRDLGFSTADELLLRKLLELHIYYQYAPPVPDNLKEVFKNIAEGKYTIPPGVENIVKDAYQTLAQVPIDQSMPEKIKIILGKIKAIASSNKIREQRLAEYIAIWNKNITAEARITEIIRIFEVEYTEMRNTLGLTDEEFLKLKEDDIKSMAEELVRLTGRVEKGESILTDAEQKAYFQEIIKIQDALAARQPPLTLNDVSFKIKHSAKEKVILFTDSQGRPIYATDSAITTLERPLFEYKMTLSAPLPYSLIKPPTPTSSQFECLLSFGGSRGITSPFAGLEAALGAKKGRFFTANRELGEGQYGAVKLARGLLSSMNYAIKKGMRSDAFKETARQNLRLRAITNKADIRAQFESDALKRYQQSRTDDSVLDGCLDILFYENPSKPRPENSELYQEKVSTEYTLIMKVAPGETLADMAREKILNYSKGEEAYHNNILRANNIENIIDELEEKLTTSEDIVNEAKKFEGKFSHNDIKPENILQKDHTISYIDWATQGYREEYKGKETDLQIIFKSVFKGVSVQSASDDGIVTYSNDLNQFVRREKDNKIYFGVHPHLEILHRNRHCTIFNISPDVVFGNSELWVSYKAGELGGEDTLLDSNDPRMDDWALTAMTFGICNRKAYFTLTRGRVVNDYVVPGVMGKNNAGDLVVEDKAQFDKYFACEEVDKISGQLAETVEANKNAVMYIPSNLREGEPFHLYRLLKRMKEECTIAPEEGKRDIARGIDTILNVVHKAIASGKGLNKGRLLKLFRNTKELIHRYKKASDPHYQVSVKRQADLFATFAKFQQQSTIHVSQLEEHLHDVNYLEILCTYPTDEKQQKSALDILQKAFNNEVFNEKVLAPDAIHKGLFKKCILAEQSIILKGLLAKISRTNNDFIKLVLEQGLLHDVMHRNKVVFLDDSSQQKVELAGFVVNALINSGIDREEIFNLMLKEYGSEKEPCSAPPGLHWITNVFHIAIRNNNSAQVALVLSMLPAGDKYKTTVSRAMHFAANLNHPALFTQILDHYNHLNPTATITLADVLNMTFPPSHISPYHLFLRHANHTDKLNWSALKENIGLAQDFLLRAPEGTKAYPCLIAASNGNLNGLKQLFELIHCSQLSPLQKKQLLVQTDANGKNLLNYLLELREFEYLSEFFETVNALAGTESMGILLELMTNVHPTDPLRNFLADEKNSSKQFEITTLLLNAICKTDGSTLSPSQRRGRLIALLVNQDWLIEKASQPENEQSIKDLLRDESLPDHYQRFLFKCLSERSPIDSDAKKLYLKFLKEVRLAEGLSEEEILPLSLDFTAILKEVALRRNDIGEFLNQLIQHEQELTQNQRQSREELASMKHHLELQTKERKQQEAEADRLNAVLVEQENHHQQFVQVLTGKNGALLEEVHTLEEQVNQLQRDILKANNTLREKTDEAQEVMATVDELSLKLQSQEQDRASVLRHDQQLMEEFSQHQRQSSEELATMKRNFELQIKATKQHEAEVDRLNGLIAEQERRHQQFVGVLTGENGTLHKEVDTLEERMNQFQRDVFEVNNTLREKTEKLQEAMTTINELSLKLQSQEKERASLQQQLQENDNLFRESSTRLKQYHSTVIADQTDERLGRTTIAFEEEFELLKLQHQLSREALLLSLNQSEKRVANLQQEIIDLRRTLEVREESVIHSSIQANALKDENSRLVTAISQIEHSKVHLVQQIQSQQENLQLADANNKRLEEALAILERKYSSIVSNFTQLQQDNKGLHDSNSSLNSQVSELGKQLCSINQLLSDERQQLEASRLDLIQKQNTLEQVTNEHSQSLAIADEYKRMFDEASKELQKCQFKILNIDSDRQKLTETSAEEKKRLLLYLEEEEKRNQLVHSNYSDLLAKLKTQTSMNTHPQESPSQLGLASEQLRYKVAELEQQLKQMRQISDIQLRDSETIRLLTTRLDSSRQNEQVEKLISSMHDLCDLFRDILARQPLPSDQIKQAQNPFRSDFSSQTDRVERIDQDNLLPPATVEPIDLDKENVPPITTRDMKLIERTEKQVIKKQSKIGRAPMTIFASLENNVDRKKLFEDDSSVIAINYSYMELNEPQLSEIKSKGLSVCSPSGQRYNLSVTETGQIKAVMTRSDTEPFPAENDSQHKQRVAVTIMNMIDNVLAQSDDIDIKTDNPFIAAIADEYIQHLRKNESMKNIVYTLKSSTQDPKMKTQAIKIFQLIRPQVDSYIDPNNSVSNLSFLKYREKVNDDCIQSDKVELLSICN